MKTFAEFQEIQKVECVPSLYRLLSKNAVATMTQHRLNNDSQIMDYRFKMTSSETVRMLRLNRYVGSQFAETFYIVDDNY